MPKADKTPTIEDQARGDTLRRLRLERKLTQAALGRLCRPQFPQQTIDKLEKGRLWSFRWVRILSEALDVDPDVFGPYASLADPREALLVDLFRKLDDTGKDYALRSLAGLASEAPAGKLKRA